MQRKAYEQFAVLEETHWWFRGRRAVYLDILADALQPKDVRRVLDLGAGVGGFLADLERMGAPVHFTEFDAESASHAADRSKATGVRARAEDLPFQSESFDLVCMFDVIEHVERDDRVLEECARVLAPGGTIAISVPAHAWLFSRNDQVAGHVRRYGRTQLERRVRDAGFVIRRSTFANVALFPAIAAAVLANRALTSLFPRALDPDHTNLSWQFPSWLNRALYRVFKSELILSRKTDLPLGHSLFLIAEKQC